MDSADEKMINDIMAHLDREVEFGAARMSVEVNEGQEEYENVSHKCCKVYGKDASKIVGQLDMYSDLYLHDMKKNGEL